MDLLINDNKDHSPTTCFIDRLIISTYLQIANRLGLAVIKYYYFIPINLTTIKHYIKSRTSNLWCIYKLNIKLLENNMNTQNNDSYIFSTH